MINLKTIVLGSAFACAFCLPAAASGMVEPTYEPVQQIEPVQPLGAEEDIYAGLPVNTPAPVKTAQDWTGFYTGVYGGWSKGTVEPEDADFDFNPDGFTVGGMVGYNSQINDYMVSGLEFDMGYATTDDEKKFSTAAYDETVSVESKATSHLRARLGFLPAEQTLVYGALGGFGSLVKIEDEMTDGTNSESFSEDGFVAGVSVGAGVEQLITKNISLRAEYLYDHTLYTNLDIDGDDVDLDGGQHTLRAAVSWTFN